MDQNLGYSQIELIQNKNKPIIRVFKKPTWNIPQIANLYNDKGETVGLSKLKLEASISNSSVLIIYQQVYKNDSKSPIECVYKFPTDYTFAVTGVSVKIGDKTIETQIMEKKEAEEKYDDAIASGHTAVKVNFDEKLPEIIELNIGQLQPKETAEITVRIISECEVIMNGFYSFIFPMNFMPKYGDPKGVKGQSGVYIPARFEAIISISASSKITSLNVSHDDMKFKIKKNK